MRSCDTRIFALPQSGLLWGSTPFDSSHTSCECGGVSAVTGLMPGAKYTFKIMACALDRPLGGWSMPTAWLRCRRRAVTSPSARALAPELPSFSAMFGEKSEHCIDEAEQRQARPSACSQIESINRPTLQCSAAQRLCFFCRCTSDAVTDERVLRIYAGAACDLSRGASECVLPLGPLRRDQPHSALHDRGTAMARHCRNPFTPQLLGSACLNRMLSALAAGSAARCIAVLRVFRARSSHTCASKSKRKRR